MTLKLFINPQVTQVDANSGIGQVVLAQFKHLPGLGFDLVPTPDRADLVASHVTGRGLNTLDVLHCHGLYWTGDPGGDYKLWHSNINRQIAEAARRALLITVPSEWVAMPFKRDMRISPVVIRHGIEADQWQPQAERVNFVLWNKNRAGDACDPTPAQYLAEKGVNVFSTFVTEGFTAPAMRVIGSTSWEVMREIIHKAKIYLATTQETYGIGTLEALAAGVPVLGFAHGGTAEIVQHKINGYLVEPGDLDGLLRGVNYILKHYSAMAANARKRAVEFDWERPMQAYAQVYQQAYILKQTDQERAVSVIITNHNYARYLEKAILSVRSQMRSGDEIIIVDDGSTDNSREIIQNALTADPAIRVIYQENKGVASARNAGIRAARKRFVACLDADDRYGPGFLEAGSQALANNRALGVVYAGLQFEDEGRGITDIWQPTAFDFEFQTTIPPRPDIPPPTLIPTPSACIFRKSMWERAGGYLQEYAPGEDTEFMTRALALGFEAQGLPGIYTTYLRHAGSASKRLKYRPIHTYNPWMVDKQYPFAAPSKRAIPVRSYSKPLVSVIIPVGPGHERFVPTCLNAVVGQSFRDWEILLIDDTRGAVDLQKYLVAYPFVRLLECPTTGVGAARNAGIAQARGDYLYLLDVDDLPFPEAMQKLLEGLSEGEACYAYSSYIEIWPDGHTRDLIPPEYDRNRLFEGHYHPITAMVDRKKIVENGIKFDETMIGYEDWDFFLQMAVKGLCGKRIPHTTAYIRVGTGHWKEVSKNERQGLLRQVVKRYDKIMNGVDKMADCGCGPAGTNIMNVKKRMGEVPPMPQNLNFGGRNMSTIRMEFIGPSTGPVPYKGVDPRRTYRAANTPLHRFHDVHPEDVQKLINSGNFRVVQREGGDTPPAAPIPDTIPQVIRDMSDPALANLFADLQPQAPVETPAPPPSDPAPTGTTKAPQVQSVTEMTVTEVQKAAPTAGKGILLAWKAEEEDGKKRAGVLKAIDDALVKLVA